MRKTILILLLLGATLATIPVYAQDSPPAAGRPAAYLLPGMDPSLFEYQGWNNCGPTTMTNALDFFGYRDNQHRAANWMKPNYEDKNVSPWQMVAFVNTQIPELPVHALWRYGGNLELMKTLLANNFPVIIEEGYNPDPVNIGWSGHYLLLIGYDDSTGFFTTHDSYIGPDKLYAYSDIQTNWQQFNYTYIVLYPTNRDMELMPLLGSDADPLQNAYNAFELARSDTNADQQNAFAWFNIGSSLVQIATLESQQGSADVATDYGLAVSAYDYARSLGLPWRMLWYQFGPFEAYYHNGQYDEVLALARSNLNNGGQDVEETFYYGGLAREALGEYDRAMSNYNAAISFNPNFTPAIQARDALQAKLNAP